MAGAFTACLLKHLLTPNLEVDELVRRVIRDVVAQMGEKQKPVCIAVPLSQIIKHNITVRAPPSINVLVILQHREDNLMERWCLFMKNIIATDEDLDVSEQRSAHAVSSVLL